MSMKNLLHAIAAKQNHVLFGMFFLALVLTRLPVLIDGLGFSGGIFKCRTNHWYCEERLNRFFPDYFLSFIKPFTRVATQAMPFEAQDQKITYHQIFGSSGNSIILDHKLADYLLKENLIQTTNKLSGSYRFIPPWNQEKLSRLGIQYIIQFGNQIDLKLIAQGWKPKARALFQELYENPETVSVVYMLDHGKRVPILPENLSIMGNGLKIKLPALNEEKELIATFSKRAGWKAWVDNEIRPLYFAEDQMIRTKIKPGDKTLHIQYEPFRIYHFLGLFLISIFMLWSAWKIAKH